MSDCNCDDIKVDLGFELHTHKEADGWMVYTATLMVDHRDYYLRSVMRFKPEILEEVGHDGAVEMLRDQLRADVLRYIRGGVEVEHARESGQVSTEVERLRKALGYYADLDNYRVLTGYYQALDGAIDGGARARQALEK